MMLSLITASIGRYLKEVRTSFPAIKNIQEGFPSDISDFGTKVPIIIYQFIRPVYPEFFVGGSKIKKGIWEINIYTAQANLNDVGNQRFLRDVMEYVIDMLNDKAIPIYNNNNIICYLPANITSQQFLISPSGLFAEKYRAIIDFELEWEDE